MELELCIAIDFTGSNGDPRRPGTLHYIHPDGSLNDYEKAITAVGSIIAKYDNDQVSFHFADVCNGSVCTCANVTVACLADVYRVGIWCKVRRRHSALLPSRATI
jgi:Copine